jgi:hypothetical protein
MKLYGGMDLHSTNVVTQLIDEGDKVLYRKKQSCDLDQILKGLEPFKDNIEGIHLQLVLAGGWSDGSRLSGASGEYGSGQAIRRFKVY